MRKCFWLVIVLSAVVLTQELSGQSPAPGSLVRAVPPSYPLTAKAAGIEGKVMLKGIVGEDGTMRGLKVLSGPVELRQAAIDAAMQWVYRPYTYNGRPVDVETTVTVNFTMGGKKEKAAAQAAAQAELAKAAQEGSTATPPSDPPAKD